MNNKILNSHRITYISKIQRKCHIQVQASNIGKQTETEEWIEQLSSNAYKDSNIRNHVTDMDIKKQAIIPPGTLITKTKKSWTWMDWQCVEGKNKCLA